MATETIKPFFYHLKQQCLVRNPSGKFWSTLYAEWNSRIMKFSAKLNAQKLTTYLKATSTKDGINIIFLNGKLIDRHCLII